MEKGLKEIFDIINKIGEENKLELSKTNLFEIKFKNLLVFTLLISSIGKSFSDIKIKEVDIEYLLEKYSFYIRTIEDREKIIKFIKSIKKLPKPDSLIRKYEEIFGDKSFFNISNELNFKVGLHELLRIGIFSEYLKMLPESRRYKVWKLFNQVNP